MARTIKTGETFCKAFMERFNGSDLWIRVIDGYPRSGECSVSFGDGELPLVDYYDHTNTLYHFSVLKVVSDWAETVGWHAEMIDPGTVGFYPN